MRLLLALAATLTALALPLAADAQDGRPDVLFIAVDDLNDWVGFLGGHPQTKTPNIDRLAARGMAFTNAHSPSALCNPSRTALLSGLRPSTSGIYGNAPDWRTVELFEAIATLPRHFRDNGYRTLGAGKIFHAHTFGPTGFTGFNDTHAWDAFYPALDRQLPDEVGPPVRPASGSRVPGFDWAPVHVDDRAMGDGQVVAWAERQLAAETGSPRFVAAGIYRPHEPWYVPPRYLEMHPLDSIELPAVRAGDLDDVPAAAPAQFSARQIHEWLLAEGKWPEAVQAYLAQISFADAMLGKVLDALDASGAADDTVIVLWSDHGWHLGEKHKWHKGTNWEEGTRVPLIVVAPGVTRPGAVCDEPVSLVDLYPTLLALCELPAADGLDGESLVRQLHDPNTPREKPAYTINGGAHQSVRSKRWRYIRYADGSEELYDLIEDPNEWANLVLDGEHSEVIDDLASHLPDYDAPDLAASGG